MRTAALILTVLASALGLAACGSDSGTTVDSVTTSAGKAKTTNAGEGAPSAGGGTLSVSADPSGTLKFDTTSLTGKAGKTTFAFTNKSPLDHNLTIQDKSGKTLGASPTFSGSSKSFILTLQPGSYQFVCTVPGHEAGGMKGTLTVK